MQTDLRIDSVKRLFLLLSTQIILAAEPKVDRPPSTWTATNGNQFWHISENGKPNPLVTGYYRTSSTIYAIVPGLFNYRTHTFSSLLTNNMCTNKLLIYYKEEESKPGVVATVIGTDKITFYLQ